MVATTVRLLMVPAAVSVIAGCGGPAQQAQSAAAPAASAVARAAQAGQAAPPGESAAHSTFTAAQLRGGLLRHINGVPPAAPVEVGAYASLAEVKASRKAMRGVAVTPARCGQTSMTGLNSAPLEGAPAAIESFHVGKNGVSEVLMAASGATAADALGKQVPVGCYQYHAVVKGKRYSYTVKGSWASGIGDQAHILNVRAVGVQSANAWSIVYRGHGILGAITVIGPDASEPAVRQLGRQSYTYAVSSLR